MKLAQSNRQKNNKNLKCKFNIKSLADYIPAFLLSYTLTTIFGLFNPTIWNQIDKNVSFTAGIITIVSIFIKLPNPPIVSNKVKYNIAALCIAIVLSYTTIPIIHNLTTSVFTSDNQPDDNHIDETDDIANENNIYKEETEIDTEYSSDGSVKDDSNDENGIVDSTNEPNDDTVASEDTSAVQDPSLTPDKVDSITADDTFVPEDSGASLFDTMDEVILKLGYEQNGENKEVIKLNINYYLNMKINSQSQPDDEAVNGNAEFTKLTKKANEIQEDIKNNGRDFEKVQEIIELREKAFDIYVTKSLCKSLASSYCELAELYLANNKNWKMAYESYVKSIEYEIIHIKLVRDNEEYYNTIYRMAIAYQSIGEISALSYDVKKTAYYISACLYEIAYEYAVNEADEEMVSKSSYYAGLTNHKLVTLSKSNKESDRNYYIVDALNYYEKSLDYKDDPKQLDNLYTYIIQVCNNAKDYINYYGKRENMLSNKEYNEKIDKYNELKSKLTVNEMIDE